jgi:hypothetical protein
MTVFFPPRAWASIIRRRCDVRVHVYIYTQFAICWKVYCQLEATDTAQTTVGASAEGLDVLPSWITKLRPSLIRTVEATNPEPPPRFGVVYVTFLRQTAKRSGGLITTRGILPKLNSAIRSVGLHAHEGFFSSSFRSNRKKHIIAHYWWVYFSDKFLRLHALYYPAYSWTRWICFSFFKDKKQMDRSRYVIALQKTAKSTRAKPLVDKATTVWPYLRQLLLT